MKKFKVTVDETYCAERTNTYLVEAESEQEAEEKVLDGYYDGDNPVGGEGELFLNPTDFQVKQIREA